MEVNMARKKAGLLREVLMSKPAAEQEYKKFKSTSLAKTIEKSSGLSLEDYSEKEDYLDALDLLDRTSKLSAAIRTKEGLATDLAITDLETRKNLLDSQSGINQIQEGVNKLNKDELSTLDATIKKAKGLSDLQNKMKQGGKKPVVAPPTIPSSKPTAVPTDAATKEDSRLQGLSKVGEAYIDEDGKVKRAKSDYQIELEAREADKVSARKVSDKLEKATAERLIGAQKSAPNTVRQIRLYVESLNELRAKIPAIEEEGLTGFAARAEAAVRTSIDEFPITRALNIRAEIIANQTARDVEGGRVTDADRKIYAMGLANAMKEPTVTNAALAAGQLSDLMLKGGNETGSITNVLIQYAYSGEKVFELITNRILENYPELIEAVYGEGTTIVEE